MVLGDNPLITYGKVKTVHGKYSDVDIIFEAEDGGFHLYVKSRSSTRAFDHYHGKGHNVQIFKTLTGAEKTAKQL